VTLLKAYSRGKKGGTALGGRGAPASFLLSRVVS